jgi:hypothetical protein
MNKPSARYQEPRQHTAGAADTIARRARLFTIKIKL